MKTPPAPRGREVFGFFGNGSAAGTIEFLERTARRYGPISSFRLLTKRIYLVDDAELIQEILVTNQHAYMRDTGATLLRELVGDGLITREEPQHRERRRVLQPAFHRDQIAACADVMARETEQVSREWTNDTALDIRKEMRRLTLSIVGSSLFGVDFRSSADAIARVLDGVVRRSRWLAPAFAFIEPLALVYRRLFPGGPSLFFPTERRELERIIAPIIEQRRAAGTHDLLSLILNQQEEDGTRLSEEEVKNEVVTFVLAGHETTAIALTWTWFLLSKYPRVEERLHAELDQILGDRKVSIEDVPRLAYTAMVFKEALRLYPPALAFARRAKHPVVLGGYTIPRGASIFLSPYITQRNERYFSRPHEFEPERWESINPPKFAYFPFGGGAKMCIGEPFARMEGIIALATLARQWRLEYADGAPDLGLETALDARRPVSMKPSARVRFHAGTPLCDSRVCR